MIFLLINFSALNLQGSIIDTCNFGTVHIFLGCYISSIHTEISSAAKHWLFETSVSPSYILIWTFCYVEISIQYKPIYLFWYDHFIFSVVHLLGYSRNKNTHVYRSNNEQYRSKYRAGWLAASSVWALSTAVAGSATLASPVLMRAGSIEFANHIVWWCFFSCKLQSVGTPRFV